MRMHVMWKIFGNFIKKLKNYINDKQVADTTCLQIEKNIVCYDKRKEGEE